MTQYTHFYANWLENVMDVVIKSKIAQNAKKQGWRRTMRLVDADALIERANRERLDSRELIVQMIESAPTVAVEEDNVALKKELDYWYKLAKSYEDTILKLSVALTKEADDETD